MNNSTQNSLHSRIDNLSKTIDSEIMVSTTTITETSNRETLNNKMEGTIITPAILTTITSPTTIIIIMIIAPITIIITTILIIEMDVTKIIGDPIIDVLTTTKTNTTTILGTQKLPQILHL